MRVAVTGGTGFVGSHAVAGLLGAGHEVRLLVRDPARAANLAAHGVEPPPDLVVGDVRDAEAVGRLLEGCDAVLHAASVFSTDPRRQRDIRETNVACTELVLGEAARRGLPRIVHVSSVVSFVPARRQTVTGESPLGAGVDDYSRSKIESEAVARRLRDQGAPVVCVMPSAVTGPIDPYLSEINLQVALALRGMFPFVPRSTWLPMVDVRDLAAVIVRGVEDAPPGSYAVSGAEDTFSGWLRRLSEATGRRLSAIPVPNAMAGASASLADALSALLPRPLPLRSSAVREVTSLPSVDNTPAREALGFSPRAPEETLADTVRWMVAAGHITPKQAGRLAPEPTMSA